MKTKAKQYKIFIGMLVILIISSFFLALVVFSKNRTDIRPSKFPVLSPSEFYLMDENYQFEDLINQSDIVIDATVLTVHPQRVYHYTPPKDDPTYLILTEKFHQDYFEIPIVDIELKVNDYIKGIDQKTITLSVAAYNLDSMPNFKSGERFLLLLRDYIDGTYAPTTCVASYFYLDEDGTVYPGGLDRQTAHFSGMKLEAVKQEFRQIIGESL